VSAGLTVGVDARELRGRPTGTGRYLRNLLRHWTARPADRYLLYVDGPPPADPLLSHERIVVRPLAARGPGIAFPELALAPAAEADGVDVFFSPAYACPLRLRRPRVTAVHDLSFFSWPEDFTVREAFRRRLTVAASIRASSVVLACSEFTRREIAGRFPDAEPRILRVPLGGPDDDIPAPPARAEARARLGLEGPLVVTVGAILNRRRLPTLLQAAARLARRRPRLVLDVVGENRTHPRLDLEALVDRLGLRATVRLSGFVSDEALGLRYAAADAAVFLSEYEGFGLPALEAAARGVPLVAADRPSLSEVFAGAALFVDPGDAGAAAEAVEGVLADGARRADLEARGRALAARHSWAHTAELTREALGRAARP
jgi:glycosyltransferase involved in cell wall biosynthesis